MRIKTLFIVLLITLLAYLFFWPVPINPVAWQAPEATGFEGDYASNKRLKNFDAIELDGFQGPEAVVIGPDGLVYASSHEGWILRGEPGADELKRWKQLGGRPLGMDFSQDGDLWVANAYSGLQRIKWEGTNSVEVTEVEGVPLGFADDVVVAPSGNIYFSDATTRFSAQEWGGTLPASLLDLLEHDGSGRIIEYDPEGDEARVIMRNLSFANGVTVDQGGRFLLVAETGSYRVWKYWLEGPRKGSSDVLIDNLPGFPDNIHRGQDGRYWVGLTSPRIASMDMLSDSPLLRKVVQRLPEFMRPNVVHHGIVLAIDENGKVLENLQDPSGTAYATTGAAETDDYLFVSSLTMPVLARYAKKDLDF